MAGIDPNQFRLNLMDIGLMNKEIAFQLNFEDDLSPREVLQNAFALGLEDHDAEKVELEESLIERIKIIMATLTPMLQKMQANDFCGPARDQIAHLIQSTEEVEESKQETTDDLSRVNARLEKTTYLYNAMIAKIQKLQEMYNARGNTQLSTFARGIGNQIPDAIRANSHRK